MRNTFELTSVSTTGGENFSGPFDLLLSLLGENKFDISEIALSSVTQQYIEYLNSIDDGREEQLADFLLVATKLLLMKSRSLLPQFAAEEEVDGSSFQDQLKLYQRFQEASREIDVLWTAKENAFFRVEPTKRPEEFCPPDNFYTDSLHESILALVYRLQPPKPLPKTHIDRTISVKEKINRVWALLKSKNKLQFKDILDSAESKTEIIVSFLALLELAKQKKVVLRQDHSFHDILIHKI
ncbi:MAG: ScpA family protein [Candidatus Magasanikbacteria bacterium]